MNNKDGMENLVGPRSGDGAEVGGQEFFSKDGQPLWMALVSKDTVVLKAEDTQDAKNRFMEIQNTHPHMVAMCKDKSLDECRVILGNSDALSQAA